MADSVKWADLSDSEKFQAACVAEKVGGSFAQKIAAAWFVADSGNKAKLEGAFGDLLVKYAKWGE